MRMYFERLLICTKCGETQRQTAYKTSFDWIGKALHREQLIEFINNHNEQGEEKCRAKIIYTAWRVGKFNYLN